MVVATATGVRFAGTIEARFFGPVISDIFPHRRQSSDGTKIHYRRENREMIEAIVLSEFFGRLWRLQGLRHQGHVLTVDAGNGQTAPSGF